MLELTDDAVPSRERYLVSPWRTKPSGGANGVKTHERGRRARESPYCSLLQKRQIEGSVMIFGEMKLPCMHACMHVMVIWHESCWYDGDHHHALSNPYEQTKFHIPSSDVTFGISGSTLQPIFHCYLPKWVATPQSFLHFFLGSFLLIHFIYIYIY